MHTHIAHTHTHTHTHTHSHLHAMKPGDKLGFQGPFTKIKYEPNKWKEIGMIAGGTGLTAMLQLLHYALDNPADKTKFNLVFANITEDDILLKKDLDGLQSKHKDRLQITYTVEKPSSAWKGEKGRVTKDMLRRVKFPSHKENVMILVCGPDGMVSDVAGGKAKQMTGPSAQGPVGGMLKDIGHSSGQVFKF
jgi:cytochrome-b5 reductase